MKKFLLNLFFLGSSVIAIAQTPIITSHPQNATVCPGQCGELRVAAAPVGTTFNYQWQQMVGGTFVNIPLDTGHYNSQNDTFRVCFDSLTVQEYRCVVSNANGADTSNTAILTFDGCEPPVADFDYSIFGDSVCYTSTSSNATGWLWNFGDNAQSILPDPCHDYGTNKIFYVRLYVYNQYGNDSIEKEINLLGLEDKGFDAKITVFPNPTTSFVNVALAEDLEIEQVYVTDMTGAVHDVKFRLVTQAHAVVETGTMGKGLYNLHIVSKGDVAVKLFLKL